MPTNDIAILTAETQHLDLLAPLFDAYRRFYRQAADGKNARRFLKDRIENKESTIFLAMRAAAGLGFTQLYPAFSSVSMQPVWILNDLYVDPDARKQGVATHLINKAREFALASGAIRLELATEMNNIEAQKLYEKLGWVKETGFLRYQLELR